MSDVKLVSRVPSIIYLTSKSVAVIPLVFSRENTIYIRGILPNTYITLSGTPLTTLSGEYLTYV